MAKRKRPTANSQAAGPSKRKRATGKQAMRWLDGESGQKRLKIGETPPSQLLALPGEIRNRIYRSALLEPDRIHLDSHYHVEPGLLRTCRQLRNETCEIFLGENQFLVPCDKLRLEPQPSHWLWNEDVLGSFVKSYTGAPSWSNFMEWMQLWHDGTIPVGPTEEVDGGHVGRAYVAYYLVPKVVDMVTQLFDLPWERVQKVLDLMREIYNDVNPATSKFDD